MIFNVKIIKISNMGTPSRIPSPNGQTPPTPHRPAIFCLKVATLMMVDLENDINFKRIGLTLKIKVNRQGQVT